MAFGDVFPYVMQSEDTVDPNAITMHDIEANDSRHTKQVDLQPSKGITFMEYAPNQSSPTQQTENSCPMEVAEDWPPRVQSCYDNQSPSTLMLIRPPMPCLRCLWFTCHHLETEPGQKKLLGHYASTKKARAKKGKRARERNQSLPELAGVASLAIQGALPPSGTHDAPAKIEDDKRYEFLIKTFRENMCGPEAGNASEPLLNPPTTPGQEREDPPSLARFMMSPMSLCPNPILVDPLSSAKPSYESKVTMKCPLSEKIESIKVKDYDPVRCVPFGEQATLQPRKRKRSTSPYVSLRDRRSTDRLTLPHTDPVTSAQCFKPLGMDQRLPGPAFSKPMFGQPAEIKSRNRGHLFPVGSSIWPISAVPDSDSRYVEEHQAMTLE